jgi:hypothetical protein
MQPDDYAFDQLPFERQKEILLGMSNVATRTEAAYRKTIGELLEVAVSGENGVDTPDKC